MTAIVKPLSKHYQQFLIRRAWKRGRPPRIPNAHLLALSGAIRDK